MYASSTESFGKQWVPGDVVGVFLDLVDHTISKINKQFLQNNQKKTTKHNACIVFNLSFLIIRNPRDNSESLPYNTLKKMFYD